MSSTINGKSTHVIKCFRDKPAALAVYWIYCARQNIEGVAWPSLRGLQRDTGWSYNTCHEARVWLESHKAIETVTDYVRPDWRDLPPAEQTQRRNLDRSCYYRVTGVLVVNDITQPLLYVNEEQSDGLDDKASDDSPGASWSASDIAPDDHELNTIEKPELASIKASAPNGAVEAEPPKPKTPLPHIAIIDAWYDGLPAAPVTRKYPRNVAVSKRIAEAGYTPEAVTDFVKDRYTDPFWADKAMSLEYVEENLPLWVQSHMPPAPLPEQPAAGESSQDDPLNRPVHSYAEFFQRGQERALAQLEKLVRDGA